MITTDMETLALEALDAFEKVRPGFYDNKACVGSLAKGKIIASHEGGDIYSLLDEVENGIDLKAEKADFFALDTCGWAAPLNEEGGVDGEVPSQHPQRRRVRLVLVVNSQGHMASALKFEDNDEIVTDDGKAHGPLATAILQAFGF